MDTVNTNNEATLEKLSFQNFRDEVLEDYRIVCQSREVSLLGRKEVLTGKAKFGIFGDGKEVAQIAMAKFFKPGDFRAGYYRDQTFMFAAGLATVEQFFAQLYADPDVNNDPFSAGRQMNAHFATKFVDENGEWLDLANKKNISSDIAPTAGQMPRALGLAFASKLFRNSHTLHELKNLSNNGNEICFCTIGDASTSEGHFWETMNAAGVLQIPLAVFVWDDGYGISVPKKYQTTKESISVALSGFTKEENTNGINIYKLKGWDYAGMCEVLEHAIADMRETHTPALFHVEEITQPQGHSTSGSHERYKQQQRLEWEKEWDCIRQMKKWIIANALADKTELDQIESDAKVLVREGRKNAWTKFIDPIKQQVTKTLTLLNDVSDTNAAVKKIADELAANNEPQRRDVMKTLATVINIAPHDALIQFYNELTTANANLFNTCLYNEGEKSALKIAVIKPFFKDDAPLLNGYEILNKYFDELRLPSRTSRSRRACSRGRAGPCR